MALGRASLTGMLDEMTDEDLDLWAAYARKHGLPQQRVELYLAQVAQVTAGGKLDKFLLRSHRDKEEEPTPAPLKAEDFAGQGVHVLRVPHREARVA